MNSVGSCEIYFWNVRVVNHISPGLEVSENFRHPQQKETQKSRAKEPLMLKKYFFGWCMWCMEKLRIANHPCGSFGTSVVFIVDWRIPVPRPRVSAPSDLGHHLSHHLGHHHSVAEVWRVGPKMWCFSMHLKGLSSFAKIWMFLQFLLKLRDVDMWFLQRFLN